MKIEKQAFAGTYESSDAFVSVEPSDKLEIQIESIVLNQYGKAIEEAVKATLREFEVQTGSISVKDRGALDCVIQARVETALKRSQLS